VYSISTFASMRPYEFIRNGPVLHRLPVRVIGIGEGVDYGHNGMTHYALEDIAIMRVQPGLTVVTPAASSQVSSMLGAVQPLAGPVYLRVSKQSVSVPELGDQFELGRTQQIVEGDDLAIVVMGALTESAVAAARLLAADGIRASVTVVSCVAPAPVEDLVGLLGSVPAALSVESHYITGGLGSLLAEVIAEGGLGCRLVRAGVREQPFGISGGRAYMHEQLGLSPERLAETAARTLTTLKAQTGSTTSA
jgi:transketolase